MCKSYINIYVYLSLNINILKIKTYINGTLYNIFTEHDIREQAKSMGMMDLLEYLLSISNFQIKRQLEFVLERLNSGREYYYV